MDNVSTFLNANPLAAWGALLVFFAVLAKSADIFVDASVSIADRLRIPRLVIGIVLVSLATTAPELSVSLTAALRGSPEMALGNAVGSIICNSGFALALCALFSPVVIAVIPRVLKSSGLFLLATEALAFVFVAFDCTLNRWEGAVLLGLFFVYVGFLYYQHKRGDFRGETDIADVSLSVHKSGRILFAMFAISLAGILVSSQAIVLSAQSIALSLGMSETVVALTLVALGTSIPEVATCVAAARKRQGAVAVGNIIGANIMNICWVAGASAAANPLTIARRELYFMFPTMLALVITMLVLLRTGYSLTRVKGLVLLALYVLFLAVFFTMFLHPAVPAS